MNPDSVHAQVQFIMNTFRNFNFRNKNNCANIAGTQCPSTNINSSAAGVGNVLSKFSKRCAKVNLLRSNPGRQATTQPVNSGSYDMKSGSSELKLEIGAPVLISKTCIDHDSINCRIPLPDNGAHQSLPSTPPGDRAKSPFRFTSPDTTISPVRPGSDDHSVKTSTALRHSRSKSAGNLHKSEIRVFLHKTPSLALESNDANQNEIDHYDVPRQLQFGDDDCHNDKMNSTNRLSSNSSVLTSDRQSTTYSSKDSLNQEHNRRGVVSEKSFSRDSLTDHEYSPCPTTIEDFNMKSDSCQSLDARMLIRSIEELNEITRRHNDGEDFHPEIDLEYCEHRDKLRPDQRRITLLRNPSTGVLNLDQKREKFGHAWIGLKNWMGEESGKFKEVIHKHASMQRVGAANSDELMLRSTRDLRRKRSASPNRAAAGNGDGDDDNGDDGWHQRLDRSRSRFNRSEDREDGGTTAGKQSPSMHDVQQGQNGFEELRRYVKQGADFGKDLVTILQERVESEQLYAKSLSKMASKLNKACREIPGSLAEGWRGVAAEMESRSEVHRLFSVSMVEDIVKPLKVILENQHKTRKTIETGVDKSARVLSEWRASEAKAKKTSHSAARDNEKLQDAMLDVRIQRSPSVAMLHHQANQKSPEKENKVTEKDCVKLDNKRRKAEESMKRADVEYYTLCIRAERARVEWEMAVLRGSTILQAQENQRLDTLNANLSDYFKFSAQMNPSHTEICDRLKPLVAACNVHKDMNVVKNIRRASEGPSEQLLPDFYCEHTTLAMNRERRKHALVKLLQLVRTDLDRERKSRSGLQVIAQSLNTPENQNVTDKLYHIRSMLTYLEGARYKLQSALMELDHKPRGAHPLASHVQITRDRTGLQQSILKVPLWLRNGDETDRLNEDYCQSELNDTGGEDSTENCTDIRNDILIKHFDRNFQRRPNISNLNCESPSLSGSGTDSVVVSNGDAEELYNDVSSSQKPQQAHTDIVGETKSQRRKSNSPTFDRGIADGGSNQPESDFDDFSSQDEDEELSNKQRQSTFSRQSVVSAPKVISRCRAIYGYTPKLYDELELTPGDMIDVHAKQEDGWWVGALKSKIGIFPAIYVEELN